MWRKIMRNVVSKLSMLPMLFLAGINTRNKNGMTMGAEIEELNLFQVCELLLSVIIIYPLVDAWQFVTLFAL
jgi:hypothetical protein